MFLYFVLIKNIMFEKRGEGLGGVEMLLFS